MTTIDNTRQFWMDIVRGLAIFLVITNHSAVILSLLTMNLSPVIWAINETFAPFRIPALTLLSGMLLGKALSRPVGQFISGKVRNIAWPYLLWSALYLVLFFFASGEVNGKPITWHTVAEVFYAPELYLWYLAYLFVFFMVALAVRRVPRLVLVVAGLGLSAFLPAGLGMGTFWFLFGFFFLGDWAGRNLEQVVEILRRPAVLVVAAVLAVAAAALSGMGFDVQYHAQYAVNVVSGIVLLSALARALVGTSGGALLASVGERSLIYYVMHMPLLVIFCQLIYRSGVGSGTVIFFAASALTVAIAWGVTQVAIRQPKAMLFFSWPAARGV
jgi:uncharacterized membrane protein YcfT